MYRYDRFESRKYTAINFSLPSLHSSLKQNTGSDLQTADIQCAIVIPSSSSTHDVISLDDHAVQQKGYDVNIGVRSYDSFTIHYISETGN